MRVVQRGDGAGLTLEPLLQVRIVGDMLGQHLDGDGAVQAGVRGLVDLAPCRPRRAGRRFGRGRARYQTGVPWFSRQALGPSALHAS